MSCQMRVLIDWLQIWAFIKKIYLDLEGNKQNFASFVEIFYKSNRGPGELEEFPTVTMQTLDCVSGLSCCLEFSQIS